MRSYFPGVFFALFCFMSTAGAAQASLQEPLLFDGDAPQVKALLKKAWAAESGKVNSPDPESAYLLYRKAAAFGSTEGYYRAALIQISADDHTARRNGLCLLGIASRLGHAQAANLLERQKQKADCR
jgi:TPR repeat protein